MIATCSRCGGVPGAVTPAAPVLHGFGAPARCDCPVEPREATEVEESAAFDEALEIGALPSFVLARRGLVSRNPIPMFLEQVEARARAERVKCSRCLASSGVPNWLSIEPLPGLTISVFSPGSWILSVSIQGSGVIPQVEPDDAIDLAAAGAHFVRVLMLEALHVPTPFEFPSGEVPF